MTDLAHITASFSVGASAFGKGTADVTGLTGDEIADLVWRVVDAHPSVCHQCVKSVIDPELEELTGFAVDGVEYVHDGDHWVVAS